MSKKSLSAFRWRDCLAKLDVRNPDRAARLMMARWFKVASLSIKSHELPWLTEADRCVWDTPCGQLPGYCWPGIGQPVLLLHGWGGRASQMAFIGQQLSAADIPSLAFDAPAHGDAGGRHSTVLQMAQAFANVAASVGGIRAVVTHSYSVGAVLLAHKEFGVRFDKMVAISPSAYPLARFDEFVRPLALSEATLQAFEKLLARRMGAHWWQRIAPLNNVAQCQAQGLIIHDRQDGIVPLAEASALQQHWPGSQLVQTDGLGHIRILSAPVVAQTIREFL
ncbi:MAG: alpha/beta hydrolase [Gammaproteobacteria bacterium]|nr:alpha/beta hydrolase [Gammaproteobacteria bacterium]